MASVSLLNRNVSPTVEICVSPAVATLDLLYTCDKICIFSIFGINTHTTKQTSLHLPPCMVVYGLSPDSD